MADELLTEETCMDLRTISLTEAKARLRELTDIAEHGEEIVITKRGRPVAVLSSMQQRRRPLDVSAARDLVRGLLEQGASSSDVVGRMRDEERY